MKNKILTAISTLMMFIPWTILPLRSFDWALKSPAAEVMISCYAAAMILGGALTMIILSLKSFVNQYHLNTF